MDEQELLKLGFTDTSWKEEETTFTEHQKINSGLKIVISGLYLVEIYKDHTYIEVPNCKTTDDLKTLLILLDMQD